MFIHYLEAWPTELNGFTSSITKTTGRLIQKINVIGHNFFCSLIGPVKKNQPETIQVKGRKQRPGPLGDATVGAKESGSPRRPTGTSFFQWIWVQNHVNQRSPDQIDVPVPETKSGLIN